jgi:two-component system CheB/CheR fusion protein
MRLVAESTKDYAIITMDRDGCVTSWNKGAERMFGYREDEVMGRNAGLPVPAGRRERGAPADEMRARTRRRPRQDERWHLRKDGSRASMQRRHTQVESGDFIRLRHDRARRDRARAPRERARRNPVERAARRAATPSTPRR